MNLPIFSAKLGNPCSIFHKTRRICWVKKTIYPIFAENIRVSVDKLTGFHYNITMGGAPYGLPLPVSPGRQSERRGDVIMNEITSSIYKHSMKLERRTASLYVQNTGCQQCPPGYGWGPGVRNHFLLHHVVSGKGSYVCRNERYELGAGDTFLVYPNTTIHYCADMSQPWEYVWVGFGGLDAGGYMARTDFTPEDPVYWGRDGQQLRELIEAVYSSYGPQPWEQMEMTARLYELLAFLVRTAQRKNRVGAGAADCALTAAEYIIHHYEEPLTIEGLAEYASVSHSSLYRRFVKRFQISPKRFLLEYRIERACALLRETGCSIQEVSTSVGFEDPFYFSRAFKDVMGISPRQYAAQRRENKEEALEPPPAERLTAHAD